MLLPYKDCLLTAMEALLSKECEVEKERTNCYPAFLFCEVTHKCVVTGSVDVVVQMLPAQKIKVYKHWLIGISVC